MLNRVRRLPLEVQERMEEARQYVNNEMDRHFNGYINLVHARHRGIFYHFYRSPVPALPRPDHNTVDLACRRLHDELDDLLTEPTVLSVDFRCRDGSMAARVQILDTRLQLEGFQTVVRVYKNWLYYNERHPQYANVTVVLE